MIRAIWLPKEEFPVLTNVEKMKLERALGMASGYVLEFSNRTFEEFFKDIVGIEIYAEQYSHGSGSKANRLRAFWNAASDDELLKFLEGIIDGWELYANAPITDQASTLLRSITTRLRAALTASRPASAINTRFEDIKFSVALSFPGTKRAYVEEVAAHLKRELGDNKVFYDMDFKAHLARPNLDVLLLNIYGECSSLVVVFLSADYAKSDWCGLEWRAVRDMIKSRSGNQLMFVRFDRESVDGTLRIDGFIEAAVHSAEETASYVLERVRDSAISP